MMDGHRRRFGQEKSPFRESNPRYFSLAAPSLVTVLTEAWYATCFPIHIHAAEWKGCLFAHQLTSITHSSCQQCYSDMSVRWRDWQTKYTLPRYYFACRLSHCHCTSRAGRIGNRSQRRVRWVDNTKWLSVNCPAEGRLGRRVLSVGLFGETDLSFTFRILPWRRSQVRSSKLNDFKLLSSQKPQRPAVRPTQTSAQRALG